MSETTAMRTMTPARSAARDQLSVVRVLDVQAKQAHAGPEGVRSARHDRHVAGLLERRDDVERAQAAARDEQRVRLARAPEDVGAELLQGCRRHLAGIADRLEAEALQGDDLESMFVEKRFQ